MQIQTVFLNTQRYALIIGVADYDPAGLNPPGSKVTDLNYADDDAVGMYGTLLSWGWLSQNIAVLLSQNPHSQFGCSNPPDCRLPAPVPNAPFFAMPAILGLPTTQSMLNGLAWLANGPASTWGQNAQVLIYFSGHGGSQPENQTAPLPGDTHPGDEPNQDPNPGDETIIPSDNGNVTDDMFRDNLANIHAGQVDVILDACHSGGFAGRNSIGVQPHPGDIPAQDVPQDIATDARVKNRTVVLAAVHSSECVGERDFLGLKAGNFAPGVGIQLAYDYRQPGFQGHGEFTDWLLEGIDMVVHVQPRFVHADFNAAPIGLLNSDVGNLDGAVSMEEAFSYVATVGQNMTWKTPQENVPNGPNPPVYVAQNPPDNLHVWFGANGEAYQPEHPEMWDGDTTTQHILVGPPGQQAVGGIVYGVDKLIVLAPYGLLAAVAFGLTFVFLHARSNRRGNRSDKGD